MQPVVAIVGPTASGKSELADALASRLVTSVVSVDAFQIYKGMDIGTAKTPAKQRRVPLLMVDICDISESYSAQRFQHDARLAIDNLLKAGKIPVLCGGTGLYLDAVIDEMSFASGNSQDASRAHYQALLDREGPQALYELLQAQDLESASIIHPHNTRRVIRALEMADKGESYAKHHEGLLQRAVHYDTRMFAVTLPRELLYSRIDSRVDAMFEMGLVDEVKQLVSSGLSIDSTAGQAIGYKEVIQALAGEITLDQARELIKTRTRHYAKRQLSWIKRDGRAHEINRAELSLDEAVDEIIQALEALTV